MRLSSSNIYARTGLPFVTSIAIAATGIWILHSQVRRADPLAGLASALLRHAPVVCPIVVGLAVGLSVWLMQKSTARQTELQAANRSLEQLNEQLRHQVQNVVQSEQRSQLLFLSNPCPMWVLDCHTMAITDAIDTQGSGLRPDFADEKPVGKLPHGNHDCSQNEGRGVRVSPLDDHTGDDGRENSRDIPNKIINASPISDLMWKRTALQDDQLVGRREPDQAS